VTKSVHDLCVQKKITLEQLSGQSGLELTRVQAIYLDKIAAVLGLSKEEIAWGHKTPIQHIYGHGPG